VNKIMANRNILLQLLGEGLCDIQIQELENHGFTLTGLTGISGIKPGAKLRFECFEFVLEKKGERIRISKNQI
jgi:hypothetical protein